MQEAVSKNVLDFDYVKFLIVVAMDGGGASLWTEARPSRALIGLSWLLGRMKKERYHRLHRLCLWGRGPWASGLLASASCPRPRVHSTLYMQPIGSLARGIG